MSDETLAGYRDSIDNIDAALVQSGLAHADLADGTPKNGTTPKKK